MVPVAANPVAVERTPAATKNASDVKGNVTVAPLDCTRSTSAYGAAIAFAAAASLSIDACRRSSCSDSRKIFCKSHSAVQSSTYVGSVAGQVRPLVRERLPARLWFSGAYMAPFALVRRLKRQHASQAAGFVAVTIAAAALIGWCTGLPLLSSWRPDLPTMRPLGALCLTALGLALVHPGKDSRVAFAVGLTVAALAALVLGLILFNIGLDIIDLWLPPRAPVSALREAPFQVASAATLAFGFAS